MTLKGSINLASAILVFTGVLFAFFTFTSKRWIDTIESKIGTQEAAAYNSERRIIKLESEFPLKWMEVDRRLQSIDEKLERMLAKDARR